MLREIPSFSTCKGEFMQFGYTMSKEVKCGTFDLKTHAMLQ